MSLKTIAHILILKLSLVIAGFSQTQSGGIIMGQVFEEFTTEPMEYVHVLLINDANPEEIITEAFTNVKGAFTISDIPVGDYHLKISFVGFETKKTDVFSIQKKGQIIDFKKIYISISEGLLEDIEIVAEKTTYNLNLSRKVYNVEKDLLGRTNTVTEMLQNLPSVDVGVNGQVRLRGTPNVTFFINGRPSALLRSNSTMALQAIPANTIEYIEVITNPSARYKPDGAGGIINIVLKEDAPEGWNGTLQENIGNLHRYSGSVVLSHGQEDFLFFANYGYRHAHTPQDIFDTRINKGENSTILSTFDSKSAALLIQNSHILTTGVEFPVSESSAMEISLELLSAKEDNKATTEILFTDKVKSSSSNLIQDRTYESKELEYEIAVGIEKEFEDEDHILAFEIAYGVYDESEDNFYDEKYFSPPNANALTHNLIEKGGPSTEIVAEYFRPIGKSSMLEAGYLGEFINDKISILGEDFINLTNQWVTDINNTNEFKFSQKNHAVYTLITNSWQDWNLTTGIRLEQTNIKSNLLTTNTTIPNNYFGIYPSLEIIHKLGALKEWRFGYSRRINRADSDEHNPFPEYDDPRKRDSGNPLLTPEKIHSLELGYRFQNEKFSFMPTAYFRYKTDAFTEISAIVEDSILQTSFTNLSVEKLGGIELIMSRRFKEYIGLTFSANGYYNIQDALNLGIIGEKNRYSWDSKLALNIGFSNSFYAQINGHYYSSRLTPQGRFDPLFLLNMGLRYDFDDDLGSLLFTVSDVFASLEFEQNIDTPTLFHKTSYGRNEQIYFVGFSFNFGQKFSKRNKNLEFEDVIEL